MSIQYIDRKNIEDAKWNTCVTNAQNGMPYAYTWYLDIVCDKQWSALIWEDYKAVMPLPFNQKLLGIKQIYHPYFVQQLGVFSAGKIDTALLSNFLKAIPNDFKKINAQLNEGNPSIEASCFSFDAKQNYLLSLNKDYDLLRAQYATLQKRNVKKAQQANLQEITIDIKMFVDFYKANPTNNNLQLTTSFLALLKRLLSTLQEKKMGLPIGIQTAKGELCAACFLLKSHHRLIYFLARSSAQGRELRAMPLLIDSIIKENAGTDLTLDFEGSSVASIGEFFRRFGAEAHTFYRIEKNDLPKWMKLLGK